MALTTVNAILAGMRPPINFVKGATGTLVAGRPHSLFYTAGFPGAATAPSPGIGGAVLTSYTGQLPFSNPGSGQETRFARLSAVATVAGQLLLCDRLWHNSGINITSTSYQAFTGSAQIPSRDANGSNLGHGVMAAVEVSLATGSGTPTITLTYTDQDGNTGQTAVNVNPTVATSIAGAFYPIGLAAGDTGIRRAEGIQLSATWTSGTIHVVLYRVLARLEIGSANVAAAIDALTGGFAKMYNDSVPFLVFIPGATTTSYINGHVIWSQG